MQICWNAHRSPQEPTVRERKRCGLRYGDSEKREGRRFIERQKYHGSEALPRIVGGNGHGSRLYDRGEAKRAERAMVVSPRVTCRERGSGPAFGESGGHRGGFAERRANGGCFGGARLAYRRLRYGGERLERQDSEEDPTEEGLGVHLQNITSSYPGLAIEFANQNWLKSRGTHLLWISCGSKVNRMNRFSPRTAVR
jgi:hypothetical protein